MDSLSNFLSNLYYGQPPKQGPEAQDPKSSEDNSDVESADSTSATSDDTSSVSDTSPRNAVAVSEDVTSATKPILEGRGEKRSPDSFPTQFHQAAKDGTNSDFARQFQKTAKDGADSGFASQLKDTAKARADDGGSTAMNTIRTLKDRKITLQQQIDTLDAGIKNLKNDKSLGLFEKFKLKLDAGKVKSHLQMALEVAVRDLDSAKRQLEINNSLSGRNIRLYSGSP